jgi:hypothetical protein
VADGACGHEAQAVLFADVVEFDCCHIRFVILRSRSLRLMIGVNALMIEPLALDDRFA